MKKIISIITSIVLVVTYIPFSAYAANITPEISLEEFSAQLGELQTEYDGNYVAEIIIENDSSVYHADGEELPIVNQNGEEVKAQVAEDNFEIPAELLTTYYADYERPEISTFSLDESVTLTKEDAQAMGYEVEINNDTAVLTQPYQTKRLIVKSKYNINELDSVAMVEGYNDLHIVQFDNQESTIEALEYYDNNSLVEYVEPDLVVSLAEYQDVNNETTIASTSSNSGINYGNHLSWGSEFIGVDDYIDYLGDIETLPEIVVGIIDTGVDLDHEFLKDRIIETNYNVSFSGEENSEEDDHGHGTHVAGIVVDNTTDNVKVKSYKALSGSGQGDLSTIVTTVDHAVADGVNVINMSLGAKGYSKAMEEAVNAATEAGVIVCVAAGNSGSDVSKYTPAGIEHCITVAAHSETDIPFWSNWGPMVDIIAPGVSINSTYLENSYEILNGTSMASPFVSAATALLLSKNLNQSAEEVCSTLEENGLKHNWYENTSQWHGVEVMYIGTITEYNQNRTVIPKFSIDGGKYTDSVIIELSCEDESAEIYYTLDGSRASTDSILYTEPIVIDEITRIHAIAKAPDKLKSLQSIEQYYITTTDPEGNFVIDTNGIITEYLGTNNYLTIPDTINGIIVTGIGEKVFYSSEVRETIVMVECPETLTYVGDKAFCQCRSLYLFEADNLTIVGNWAFRYCSKLEVVELTKLEDVGEFGFGLCKSIPSVYNDKLTRLEKGAFHGLQNAVAVEFPNVEYIGYWGLNYLTNATTIKIPKVKILDTQALSRNLMVESYDFPELTTLVADSNGGQFLGNNGLKLLNSPKLSGIIPDNAFSTTGLETINFQNITTVGNYAFENCYYLKTIYLPTVTSIGENTFEDTNTLQVLFVPNLNETLSFPETNNVRIYLSSNFTSSASIQSYIYIIIAPTGSYAQTWAEENGHSFEPSNEYANALGGSIRVTDAGLRFGYSWDELAEIETLAENIEYGFVYSYSTLNDFDINTEGIKKKVANNLIDYGDYTTFNLVFTVIPLSAYNQTISARAYVYIDGMYFYSPIIRRNFNGVAQAILADETVDQETKDAINELLSKEI